MPTPVSCLWVVNAQKWTMSCKAGCLSNRSFRRLSWFLHGSCNRHDSKLRLPHLKMASALAAETSTEQGIKINAWLEKKMACCKVWNNLQMLKPQSCRRWAHFGMQTEKAAGGGCIDKYEPSNDPRFMHIQCVWIHVKLQAVSNPEVSNASEEVVNVSRSNLHCQFSWNPPPPRGAKRCN